MADLGNNQTAKNRRGNQHLLTGCGNMISIVVIMVLLAYALSAMIDQLGTAEYLSSLLTKFMAPAVFSAVAFLFTCIISFPPGPALGPLPL